MTDYHTNAQLDVLLKHVKKGNHDKGILPPLPLPDSFWDGLKALQESGIDLEWTRGMAIKKTVFERLGAQLTRANHDQASAALMYAEFEKLWALTGHPHSLLHKDAWWQLLGISHAAVSDQQGKDYYGRFVEWGLKAAQANPHSFHPISLNLLLDASVSMDRPEWVEAIVKTCPDADINWPHLMGRGGMGMLHYYQSQGWNVDLPPPGAKSAQTESIREVLDKGVGTRALMPTFWRQHELDQRLPAPAPSRKGPRF